MGMPPLLANLDLPPWAGWVAVAGGGALVTVLVFLLGALLLSRRQPQVGGPGDGLARDGGAGRGQGAPPDPFTFGTAGERREAARRGGNQVAVLITDPLGTGQPFPGVVVNRSGGGLCLAIEGSTVLAVGATLLVRPALAPVTVPRVEVIVINRRSAGARWLLGCQFVRMPPYSVLVLFG